MPPGFAPLFISHFLGIFADSPVLCTLAERTCVTVDIPEFQRFSNKLAVKCKLHFVYVLSPHNRPVYNRFYAVLFYACLNFLCLVTAYGDRLFYGNIYMPFCTFLNYLGFKAVFTHNKCVVGFQLVQHFFVIVIYICTVIFTHIFQIPPCSVAKRRNFFLTGVHICRTDKFKVRLLADIQCNLVYMHMCKTYYYSLIFHLQTPLF